MIKSRRVASFWIQPRELAEEGREGEKENALDVAILGESSDEDIECSLDMSLESSLKYERSIISEAPYEMGVGEGGKSAVRDTMMDEGASGEPTLVVLVAEATSELTEDEDRIAWALGVEGRRTKRRDQNPGWSSALLTGTASSGTSSNSAGVIAKLLLECFPARPRSGIRR